jgi:hypothetical protein
VANESAIDADRPADAKAEEGVRFGILLACLLVELMIAPLFLDSAGGEMVARVTGATALVAALFAVGMRRLTLVMFAMVFAAQLLADRGSASSVEMSVTLRLLFYGYVTGLILWHVLTRPAITMDAIAGAACVYVLIGVVWLQLYRLLELARPGSFEIPAGFVTRGDPSAAFMYFSFTTLTTVGYGDVHAATSAAGGVCVAEAIVGQLYLAIMIARMVGVMAARRS